MKSILQILFAGTLFALTGCVTLYKPNTVYSPLIKEKGELNASASMGMSGCGLYNLQSAYGISDHTGIMIDGMYHQRHSNNIYPSDEKLNILFGEAGVGYFNTFDEQKNTLFQCYSGAGYGNTSDKIYNTNQINPEVNAKYYNIFIQPGIAITNKNFELAFDLRMNYVHLYNIHAYLYDKFEWWNSDFHFYNDTSLYFVNLEPTLTLKVGGEKLKGIFQFGATIPTINTNSYFMVNTTSLLGFPLIKTSVGISYTFGKK